MAGRLSDDQYFTIRESVRTRGNLAFAAHAAGVPLSYLKSVMARDDAFASEINDELEIFSGTLFVHALERATTGKSDALLVKILEAKMPEFSPDGRKAAHAQTNRIAGVRLRTFDAEGNETGVSDVQPKTPPAAPLLLDVHRGL